MKKLVLVVAAGVLLVSGCSKESSELALNNFNCFTAAGSSLQMSPEVKSFNEQCRQARLGPYSSVYEEMAVVDYSCAADDQESCAIRHQRLSRNGFLARWKSAD